MIKTSAHANQRRRNVVACRAAKRDALSSQEGHDPPGSARRTESGAVAAAMLAEAAFAAVKARMAVIAQVRGST